MTAISWITQTVLVSGSSRRKPQNRLPTPRSTGRSRGDLVLVQLVLCIMLAVFPLLCLLGMGCLILSGGFDDLLEMFGALDPGERRGGSYCIA